MGRLIWFNIFTIALVTWSCSGGSSSGTSENGLERNSDTAVRIIHASLDSTPFDLWLGPNKIQTARFGEIKYYQSVEEGSVSFLLSRANDPTSVVASLPYNLARDTEYSLFIYGRAGEGQLRTVIIPDNTARPAEGKCLIRVINAYLGENSLAVSGQNFSFAKINYGTASSFAETSCEQQVYQIKAGDSLLHSDSLVIPEDGEATMVVSGSKELALVLANTYLDLD